MRRALESVDVAYYTYRELTSKTPTSLKEWVAAHQDAFAPADAVAAGG